MKSLATLPAQVSSPLVEERLSSAVFEYYVYGPLENAIIVKVVRLPPKVLGTKEEVFMSYITLLELNEHNITISERFATLEDAGKDARRKCGLKRYMVIKLCQTEFDDFNNEVSFFFINICD
jgi:hypothetical protein